MVIFIPYVVVEDLYFAIYGRFFTSFKQCRVLYVIKQKVDIVAYKVKIAYIRAIYPVL